MIPTSGSTLGSYEMVRDVWDDLVHAYSTSKVTPRIMMSLPHSEGSPRGFGSSFAIGDRNELAVTDLPLQSITLV